MALWWLLLSSALAVLATGCSASPVAVAAESTSVRTGTQTPGAGFQEVGAITATHGGGCGGVRHPW
jgi:hypothetical protein